MLMRKKLFFGLAAAALVALNVAVFTTTSHALPPEPPVTNGCYQTRSYCKDGATLMLRDNCTAMNTGKQCRNHFCVGCFPTFDNDIAVFGRQPRLDEIPEERP